MPRLARLPILLAALWLAPPACRRAPDTTAPRPPATHGPAGLPVDRPIAPWQTELLTTAFTAASALPLDPHVKNRARAQAAVVSGCLQLDQPERAATYLQGIPNWQRGVAAAELAAWCVRHGAAGAAAAWLDLAETTAQAVLADPREQGWRAERIRARVADTILMLDDAARRELGVEGSGGLTALLARVDAVLVAGDLEQMTGALLSCADAFAAPTVDAKGRELLLERARKARVPATVRIDTTLRMADALLASGAAGAATALLDEVQPLLAAGEWLPEDAARFAAQTATLRHRAGDRDRAIADLTTATEAFARDRTRIASVFAGQGLRPLAEAWHRCGDTGRARNLLRDALTTAVVNPNSRPRAEDLVATCLLLATAAIEPDAELLAQVRQVAAGLGSPW